MHRTTTPCFPSSNAILNVGHYQPYEPSQAPAYARSSWQTPRNVKVDGIVYKEVEDWVALVMNVSTPIVPFPQALRHLQPKVMQYFNIDNIWNLSELAHVAAVRILASCFTTPSVIVHKSPPRSPTPWAPKLDETPKELESCLRQQTNQDLLYSPTSGHQPRHNSLQPADPRCKARSTPTSLAKQKAYISRSLAGSKVSDIPDYECYTDSLSDTSTTETMSEFLQWSEGLDAPLSHFKSMREYGLKKSREMSSNICITSAVSPMSVRGRYERGLHEEVTALEYLSETRRKSVDIGYEDYL